jgi:hypothetical protein
VLTALVLICSVAGWTPAATPGRAAPAPAHNRRQHRQTPPHRQRQDTTTQRRVSQRLKLVVDHLRGKGEVTSPLLAPPLTEQALTAPIAAGLGRGLGGNERRAAYHTRLLDVPHSAAFVGPTQLHLVQTLLAAAAITQRQHTLGRPLRQRDGVPQPERSKEVIDLPEMPLRRNDVN